MYEEIIRSLETAHQGQRSLIVGRYAQTLGISDKTLYRRLRSAGWGGERKKRSDAGTSEVPETSLVALAAYMKSGIRSNDKATLTIPSARQVLETNGVDFRDASNTTLARLLRDRGMDTKTQQAPEPHVRMRSEHPNAVHMCDPSLCLVYYLPNGGQRILEEREVYKNKPFLAGKENLKVWRYVLTDHYSGSICVRYYNVAGENQLTLWDFLLYAWGPKNGGVFHGVPELLVWDKGSANTSRAIDNALRGLRVDTYAHKVGNPRAKGSVERSNNIVETLFESRLKAQPVKDIDELNEYAARWCDLYNANLLKGYDSRLRRAGSSREELWLTITADQLRELPEGAASLLVDKPETRTVGGDLCVSYAHPRLRRSGSYCLGGLPGIRPKIQVEVQPILTDPDGVLRISYAYQDGEVVEELYPQEIDVAGFPLSAPVWGVEFKRAPDTYVQTAGKRLDEVIGNGKKPFAEWNDGEGLLSLDAIESSAPALTTLPRTGKPVEPPKPLYRISVVEAAKRLSVRLGWWTPSCLAWLRDSYKGQDGVPERDLDGIEARLADERRDECNAI